MQKNASTAVPFILQISMSVLQTTEDVAPTPAAATWRVASNVAVTQDTTEMESPALVGYR